MVEDLNLENFFKLYGFKDWDIKLFEQKFLEPNYTISLRKDLKLLNNADLGEFLAQLHYKILQFDDIRSREISFQNSITRLEQRVKDLEKYKAWYELQRDLFTAAPKAQDPQSK